MFEIFCTIFDLCLLIIFFDKAFKGRKESLPSFVFYFILIGLEALFFTASLYYSYSRSDQSVLLMTLISFLILLAQTFLYESRFIHRIFAALSFQLIGTLSEFATYILCLLLPQQIREYLLNDYALCAIISKLFLMLMIMIVIITFFRNKEKYSLPYSLLICFTPSVSIMILVSLEQAVLGKSTVSFPIVGAVGLLFSNIINYYLLNNLLNVKKLEQEQSQLNQQINYQTVKYQQISTAYRNTRRLIHDTKKHYFFIQQCIEDKKYDIISDYLKQSIKDIEVSYNRINTGNLVIDAFVSNYISICEKEGIEIQTNIQVNISRIPIEDYDFSIILGNLLDNSINACRKIATPKPRQLVITLRTTHKKFIIYIKNKTCSDDNNAKKNELVHGFGTTNIENITLKYYGNYTHFIEHDWYHAVVAIPIMT